MAKMRCGVAVVEALRAVGATTIFGLMGSSTLEIYDALYDATDFTYIGVRHENCGMHMADAYGRVTQTPGVFICGQAGPGAANMVLGLAQAKLADAPVVVITAINYVGVRSGNLVLVLGQAESIVCDSPFLDRAQWAATTERASRAPATT